MFEKIVIQGSATFKTRRSEQGFWISECEDLGITLQSVSGEEVKEDIESALKLLFHDLGETGEMRSFAEKHGWTIQSVERSAPAIPAYAPRLDEWALTPDRENQINVPFLPEWSGAVA